MWQIRYLGCANFSNFSRLPSGNGLGGGCLDLPQTLSQIAEIDMLYDTRHSHHRYNLVTSVGHMRWRDRQLGFLECL